MSLEHRQVLPRCRKDVPDVIDKVPPAPEFDGKRSFECDRLFQHRGPRVGRPLESRWAWRVGSIAGVDLYLHFTFVALVVWIAVSHLSQRHGLTGVAGALVLNLAVFGIVVVHELGHALVARHFGINTRDITLWPIGGIARLERMPDKPRQELLVAAAGPAVNFALAGLLAALFSTRPTSCAQSPPSGPMPRWMPS